MNDWGKLILRAGVSMLLITHGWGKFIRLIEQGTEAGFSDPLGIGSFPTLLLAVLAEVVCPIAIIIGWKTRWATIPPMVAMAVAAFMVHVDDPWGKQELPLLYLTGFLAIALLGSGKLAVEKD